MKIRAVVGMAIVGALTASVLTIPVVAPWNTSPSAQAASSSGILDVPTGQVNATAVDANGITYAVGSFTTVGAFTGGFAKLSTSTGLVDRSFPPIAGSVYALTPDGSGGAYIAGNFTYVDGQARPILAHILADGGVNPNWSPNVTGGAVVSLFKSGNTLYFGGEFTSVNGTTRVNVAAVRTDDTGSLLPWNPSPNFGVTTISGDDSAIYVGGAFTSIGGQSRNRLAALDLSTGNALAWNPTQSATTISLVSARAGLVYVGGIFGSIGGQARNNLAALNGVASGNANATSWNPSVNQQVNTIAFDDTIAYIGGPFTGVGYPTTLTRNRAAAVRTDDTGTLLPWNPNLNDQVSSISVSSDAVFVGGNFSTVGGGAAPYLAKLDKSQGTRQAWDAALTGWARSVQVSGSSVMVGGEFSYVNLVERLRGAAFDAEGRVTSWDPQLGAEAMTIAVSGSTAYVGGSFTTVKGNVIRNRAAAFSTTGTGALTGWDPNPNNRVNTIALDDTVAYLGGLFTSVNGTEGRNRLAAVRIDDTGTSTAWNPAADSEVLKIALDDTVAYVVGSFITINSGATVRTRAAAVRTDDTGSVTSWNPTANDIVRDVAPAGNLVYLAGDFTTLQGSSRQWFGAVSAADGAPSSWAPAVTCTDFMSCSYMGMSYGKGMSIAVSGTTAYLGGRFDGVNGTATRAGLAAVSTSGSGTLDSSWIPMTSTALSEPTATIRSLRIFGTSLSVAGTFGSLQLNGVAFPRNLASIVITPGPPAAPSGVTATAGDTTASIAWSPGSNGGSPITRVDFALDDTLTIDDSTTNTSSPHTLTGLTNGTSRTVYVRLVNANGPGPWSTPSTPFTPSGPPAAPTGVTATAGNTTASIAWTPGSNGGSPITRIDFALDDTLTIDDSTTNTSSPHTLTGLTNGTSRTVYVRLVNANGPGPWSTPSTPFTPTGSTPAPTPGPPGPGPAQPPGIPLAVTATAGDASAIVSWTPPTTSGSSPVTSYAVTALPGAQSCTTTTTSCTVTGLTNGTAYTFTVTASNAAGTGAASAPSDAVTPRGVPSPPTSVAGAAGVGTVAVTWSPPDNNGGSAITGYIVRTSPSTAGCTTEGLTFCLLTELTPGTTYTVTVSAFNALGESAPSAPTTVTPRMEPTILITGTREGNRITVSGTVTNSEVSRVRPRYRLDGQKRFRTAAVSPPIVNGQFTWERMTRRSITVYMVAQGLISNRVVIR